MAQIGWGYNHLEYSDNGSIEVFDVIYFRNVKRVEKMESTATSFKIIMITEEKFIIPISFHDEFIGLLVEYILNDGDHDA